MKTISIALADHLAQPLTTLATCWRVTRADGQVFGFTDHDRDIEFDSILYRAATGYTATDVASGTNLDVDNLEIEGILDAPSITEEDLYAGLWDGAQIKIFQVNWADLTQGGLNLRIGNLGQVRKGQQQFRAELLGLMLAYTKTIGELTSAGCRATLGDERCGVDLAGGSTAGSPSVPFTQAGSVDSWDEATLTITDDSVSFPYPGVGKITFTSGDNAGRTFEAKTSVAGVSTTLQMLPPYTVSPGDTYSAVIACDKALRTCIDVFDNVVNMRAEPYLAGNDKLVQVGRHT